MKAIKYTLLIVFVAVSALVSAQKIPSKGIASYYSNRLHGRRMSNGQRYNRDSMTCAHLKYPLGTMLKVRNPMNGKEVVVKVTDRGPFTKRFIIDLSWAAAKKLGILGAGFTQVEVTQYKPGTVPFKAEEKTEDIPELDLEYQSIATYPHPLWEKSDSTAETPAGHTPSGNSHYSDNAGNKR